MEVPLHEFVDEIAIYMLQYENARILEIGFECNLSQVADVLLSTPMSTLWQYFTATKRTDLEHLV